MLAVARRESDASATQQLFVALAPLRDGQLAMLSQEIALAVQPPTIRPRMIRQVTIDNPELAGRFALEHLDELKLRLDEMGDKLVPSGGGIQRPRAVRGTSRVPRRAGAVGAAPAGRDVALRAGVPPRDSRGDATLIVVRRELLQGNLSLMAIRPRRMCDSSDDTAE